MKHHTKEARFSADLLATLQAICDTFIPSLDDKATATVVEQDRVNAATPADDARQKAVHAFCTHSASAQGVPEVITHKLRFLPPDVYLQTVMLIRALGTSAGTFLLTGHARPFRWLSQPQREAAMLGLATSMLPQLRKAFRAFKALASSAFMNMPDNPNWAAVNYGGPEKQREKGRDPVHKHSYSMMSLSADTEMEVDVVIVGSGCGGGVMAAELSAAGLAVLVLEKGPFVQPEDMSQGEGEGFDKMYEPTTRRSRRLSPPLVPRTAARLALRPRARSRTPCVPAPPATRPATRHPLSSAFPRNCTNCRYDRGGLLTTEDGAISIFAGSVFGGGTTVNWWVCRSSWLIARGSSLVARRSSLVGRVVCCIASSRVCVLRMCRYWRVSCVSKLVCCVC
jgi:hypothetical protein